MIICLTGKNVKIIRVHSKESVDNSMSSSMGNETKKLGTEIDVLKKQIEYLEKILDQAGIPYDVEQNSEPKLLLRLSRFLSQCLRKT